MNLYFENTYQFSHDIAVEYQYKVGGKRMITYSILCLLFALVYCVLGMVTNQITWYLVVALLVLTVYYAVYPYTFTKKTEKKLLQRSGGVLPVTRIFFRDSVECTESDGTGFELEYEDIKKVTVLKRGIFITTGGHRGILVDPEGFTVGKKEDFLPFLKEKCPDITWVYK